MSAYHDALIVLVDVLLFRMAGMLQAGKERV